MSVESELYKRSDSKCELCRASETLSIYPVPPSAGVSVDNCVLICDVCQRQLDGTEAIDVHHWRVLNDTMWSQVAAVQVLVWRLLTRLSSEGWPQGLLDMLYLDDETLKWAKATGEADGGDQVQHKDAHGALLDAGDSVVLIKDLVVKGANFTAKRGTAVRKISLVPDNPDQIEGRVNGQQIVILTQFVKKS